MTLTRKKRMLWILSLLCSASIATAFALAALQENINLFYTPTQIVTGEARWAHVSVRAAWLKKGR